MVSSDGEVTALHAGYAGVVVFGATASQTVAIGCLAYNVYPMLLAPFLNMEVETLELG